MVYGEEYDRQFEEKIDSIRSTTGSSVSPRNNLNNTMKKKSFHMLAPTATQTHLDET